MNQTAELARRAFLRLGLAVPPFILAACATPTASPTPTAQPQAAAPRPANTPAAGGARPANTPAPALTPTPACGDDDDDPTPAQTEGPYFKPNSPQRVSLVENGMGGARLIVTGQVLNTRCQPVARALVDFWQCDDRGVYDNNGFRLCGHQFTDAEGRYRLETILPGIYTGRTRHIHVKVQAPNRPVLTTQLYFLNEPANARDGIFNRELVMAMQTSGGTQTGAFDFVLNV
jgi:protocatechuate 3,4-dioxygenase beta subunit